MKGITFHNTTLSGQLSFEEMVLELIHYIQKRPRADYRITIGTDSPGTNNPFFITAITILRVGNGGRYFWTKSKEIQCHSLQERIYKEVMQSVTLTQELKSHLKKKVSEDYFWDDKITVHIDVGRNGRTKDFIDSVVGMVKGYGFEVVIKPDAFCAYVVADKHT